jgi:hypothetical protein
MTPHRRSRAKSRPVQDSWLTRHRHVVLGVIVAASIAARITYFLQLSPTTFVELHRWRQTDMHYYDGWATRIAAGDWQSRSVNVPMHRWHHDVAARYFAEHPDTRAALERTAAPGGPPVDVDAKIWRNGCARLSPTRTRSTHLLAATQARRRGRPLRLRVAAALGVLTNVPSGCSRDASETRWPSARRRRVLCGPLMFYELLLLRDSLIAFTGLALVWLIDRVPGRALAWFGILGLASASHVC